MQGRSYCRGRDIQWHSNNGSWSNVGPFIDEVFLWIKGEHWLAGLGFGGMCHMWNISLRIMKKRHFQCQFISLFTLKRKVSLSCKTGPAQACGPLPAAQCLKPYPQSDSKPNTLTATSPVLSVQLPCRHRTAQAHMGAETAHIRSYSTTPPFPEAEPIRTDCCQEPTQQPHQSWGITSSVSTPHLIPSPSSILLPV